MKAFHLKTAIMIVIACMLLFTGCSGSKLSQVNPEDTNGLEETQTSATGDVSNSTPQDETAPSEGTANTETDMTAEQTNGTENEGTPDDKSAAPVKAKALYLTGWTAGSMDKINHYVELANTTEINAYVVDIKDDDGLVGYESQVPEVKANGTWKKKYNPDTVIKAFHDNDIYVIGRLVAFKDPVYSIKRPDLAIKSTAGGVWKDNKSKSWLNPYNKDAWDYLISIAREAVEKGFDEIQFDYVRFPSDGKKSMNFSGMDKEKYEAICEFLAYAAAELPGVPISADVFGIIFESPADTEGIGQYLEYVGKDIDYICPMVYPSHYAYGQIVNKVKFDVPDLDPYGVVYNTLLKGKERISKVEGYKAGVRPYLQDFTASWLKSNGKKMYQEYGVQQAKEQIKAVYDAGYEEWIFWDPSNTYHEEAFEKETK